VVADYIASSGTNELSVSKGQQVEIVEPPTAGEPDFCLVRLNPQHEDAAVQEGLVPVSVLKPPPGSHKHGSGSGANAAGAAGSQKSDMQDQGKSLDFIYVCDSLFKLFLFCFLQAIAARRMPSHRPPNAAVLAGE